MGAFRKGRGAARHGGRSHHRFSSLLFRSAILALLAVVSSLQAAPPAAAQDEPREVGKVMLVLDASGSMWGQIDEVAKIQIARETVAGLFSGLDGEMDMGLMAYGHREEGNCQDIQTLIPVGQGSPEAIVAAVNGIKPLGKTPLSESVRRAARELGYAETKATVILVSDGLENCNADPCAVAAELEAAGVDFTAHVVGFDLSEEEQQALSCMAENTGGRFLAASDAASLGDALSQVVRTTQEAAPTPVGGIAFQALLTESGPVVERGATWSVFAVAADGSESAAATDSVAQPKFDLEPGNYIARVTAGLASAEAAIEVTEDGPEQVQVILNAGIVSARAFRSGASEAVEGALNWTLLGAGGSSDTSTALLSLLENNPEIVMPAGSYTLAAQLGVVGGKTAFEIAPGDLLDVEVVLESGTLVPVAVLTEGGRPLVGDITWRVIQTDANGEETQIVSSPEGRPELELPAGTHLLRVSRGHATAELPVTIEANTRHDLMVNLNAALVTTKVTAGNPAWTLFRFDEAGERVSAGSAFGVSPVWTLNAGRYVIRAADGNAVAEAEVEVAPGDEQQHVLTME